MEISTVTPSFGHTVIIVRRAIMARMLTGRETSIVHIESRSSVTIMVVSHSSELVAVTVYFPSKYNCFNSPCPWTSTLLPSKKLTPLEGRTSRRKWYPYLEIFISFESLVKIGTSMNLFYSGSLRCRIDIRFELVLE